MFFTYFLCIDIHTCGNIDWNPSVCHSTRQWNQDFSINKLPFICCSWFSVCISINIHRLHLVLYWISCVCLCLCAVSLNHFHIIHHLHLIIVPFWNIATNIRVLFYVNKLNLIDWMNALMIGFTFSISFV